MTITGPELMIFAGMGAAFFSAAWFFIIRPYEKRQQRD